MAMEARCYRGGSGRTRLHEMKLKTRDIVAFILEAAFLVLIILEARYF
jgi:energy-coupling factor transport system permease protein